MPSANYDETHRVVASHARDGENVVMGGALNGGSIPEDSDSTRLPDDFFSRSEEERVEWIRALRGPQPEKLTVEGTLLWIFDEHGSPHAIAALTEIMEKDQSVNVQRSALGVLRRSQDRAAIPGLLIGLKSEDLASCLSAIMAFEALKAREGVPILIGLLDNTERKDFLEMREHAAQALVAIGDERALEPMRAASKRGWPWSRRRIRRYADELSTALGN
jgi:HEAT repeat protein